LLQHHKDSQKTSMCERLCRLDLRASCRSLKQCESNASSVRVRVSPHICLETRNIVYERVVPECMISEDGSQPRAHSKAVINGEMPLHPNGPYSPHVPLDYALSRNTQMPSVGSGPSHGAGITECWPLDRLVQQRTRVAEMKVSTTAKDQSSCAARAASASASDISPSAGLASSTSSKQGNVRFASPRGNITYASKSRCV
jgi:hypothetical protein